MKLFASSQDATSNAIQNTNIELSEQELSAITGGCGSYNGCGGPQDPGGFPGFSGGEGYNFGGESFSGEGYGFFIPFPRPCHPHYHHHCCRY